MEVDKNGGNRGGKKETPSFSSSSCPDHHGHFPASPLAASPFDNQQHSVTQSCYHWWAHFVVQNPYKIVLFCFLLTGICAVKMANTRHKNDIRGYTPYGARALGEFDIRDQFFGQSGVGIRFFVLLLPRRGDNMLTVDTLREAAEVDQLVQQNITIFNRLTGKHEPFSRICRRFCTINEPVQMFYLGWKEQQGRMARGEPRNSRIQLDYPFSMIFGRQVNIQPNFFGIHLLADGADSIRVSADNNGTVVLPPFTNMASAEMIVLLYRAERIGGWSDDDISDYEMKVSNYFKSNFSAEHIHVLTISTSYAQLEVQRSGNILRTFIGFGVLVMAVCSLLSNSLSAFFMRQFSLYRLPVALFACLCPFMASATALGLLFFMGFRNGSILGVTSFLILAIGVDDAFLVIHSWQLATAKRRRSALNTIRRPEEVDPAVKEQLAEVLEDTGPAILISALTNIFADIVGSFTGSPEITLLCVGNIASIVVDFFYQITLFTAVLVICARWQILAKLRRRRPAAVVPAKDAEGGVNGSIGRPSPFISSASVESAGSGFHFRHSLYHWFTSFCNLYIRFVSSLYTAILICVLWLALLAVCLNAIFKFEINLTTKKLFPPDSPLLEIENYREDKVLPFYTTAQLFVNNPGDLSNRTRRRHLNELIEEMEHLPYAYPAESSLYFVRDFQAFEDFINQEDEEESSNFEAEAGEEGRKSSAIGMMAGTSKFDLSDLEAFLNWPEYKHWKGLINYHIENGSKPGGGGDQRWNTTTVLDSFMATVAYHGEALKDWHQRALVLRDWRQLVDKYKEEFNVTVLHDDGLYLDLLENMPSDIWQSAVATLFCMGLICALFMRNLFVVCVTTIVIASIFVETLGLMALMGMTLDPVVMAAVITSIGFSVDIPAHMSYHFHAAKREGQKQRRPSSASPQQDVEWRVRFAFNSVGFPALQASTCTSICVLVLLIVPVYMAQVFVRVLCVCIVLCTIHSLCILPAIFSLFGSIESVLRLHSNSNKTIERQDEFK